MRKYKITILFAFISCFFLIVYSYPYNIRDKSSSLSKLDNLEVRMKRSLENSVLIRNYDSNETFSESELREYKNRFPTDPEEGEWADVDTDDTYWLTLPLNSQGELENIKKFVEKNKGEYEDIVTVGMGGSSRPTDVASMFQKVLHTSGADLHVLETLDENSINELLDKKIDFDSTLFVIISKSGSTAETLALANLASSKESDFIAITTTSKESKLMKFLKSKGIPGEDIQEHPKQVGGRYTFFSNIGMLPAALGGVDIESLLRSAQKARKSDVKYKLGKFLSDMEKQGRIYGRIILPEELTKLGPWIEQLVAESLGKHDKEGNERGIIAISERDFDPSVYKRGDVFAIRVKLGENDGRNEFTQQVVKQGTPLFEFNISSPEEVAGVMYNLEFATGMSGILMGINPFNQPGVEAKKQLTRDMKTEMKKSIESDISSDMSKEGIFNITKKEFQNIIQKYRTDYRVKIAEGVTLDYGDYVKVLQNEYDINFRKELNEIGIDFKNASATQLYRVLLTLSKGVGRTYSAILPYDETYKNHTAWAEARGVMREFGLVDIFGVGPVYEHSYSQFFHEGPNKGILTYITSTGAGDKEIPGDEVPGITFSMQNTLQALGAMEAEVTNKIPRLAVRIEIDGEFNKEKMEVLERFFDEVRSFPE